MDFNYRKNFFYGHAIIMKKYKQFTATAFEGYDFTPAEIDVLTFLINNGPVFNKASDISKYRGISKGLVSRSVNSLEDRGLISSTVDPSDKRAYILKLTDKASSITEKIKENNQSFREALLENIPKNDLNVFFKTNDMMIANIEGDDFI